MRLPHTAIEHHRPERLREASYLSRDCPATCVGSVASRRAAEAGQAPHELRRPRRSAAGQTATPQFAAFDVARAGRRDTSVAGERSTRRRRRTSTTSAPLPAESGARSSSSGDARELRPATATRVLACHARPRGASRRDIYDGEAPPASRTRGADASTAARALVHVFSAMPSPATTRTRRRPRLEHVSGRSRRDAPRAQSDRGGRPARLELFGDLRSRTSDDPHAGSGAIAAIAQRACREHDRGWFVGALADRRARRAADGTRGHAARLSGLPVLRDHAPESACGAISAGTSTPVRVDRSRTRRSLAATPSKHRPAPGSSSTRDWTSTCEVTTES